MTRIPVYLVDDGTVSFDDSAGTRPMIGYFNGGSVERGVMYVATTPETTIELPMSVAAARSRTLEEATAEALRLLEEQLDNLGSESVQLKVVSVPDDGLITARAVGYAPTFEVSVKFAKYPNECPCGIMARDCDYHRDSVR
jgi:hypothetical protein